MLVNIKKIYFLIIILIFFTLGFHFVGNDELDIGRYYNLGYVQDIAISDIDFIKIKFDENFDFIYFYILFLLKKYDLDLRLISGFFVSLFFTLPYIYYLSFKNFKFNKYYIIFSFLMMPNILIFSISRSVAAFVFFYTGILFFNKNRKILASILFFISVFTHLSNLVYSILFLISYFFVDKIYNSKKFKLYFVLILIFSLLIPRFFIPYIIKIPFFSTYERYVYYLIPDSIGYDNFNVFTIINYFCILIFFTICFYNKVYSIKIFKSFFGLYLFLVFSSSFSITLFQRNLIFMSPLILISLDRIIEVIKVKKLKYEIVKLLIFITIATNLLITFTYRDGFKF